MSTGLSIGEGRESACVAGHTADPSGMPGAGHRSLMSNDKAAEAREGLIGNIAGKAKEVAGAVSGKDDLVEEGQLLQAEAANRRDAVADEAIAEAKREEAAHEVRETSKEAAEQQKAAKAAAERQEAAAERQRANEHADATRDAERQQAEGQKAAERQAEKLAESRLDDAEAIEADATSTEQAAAADKLRLEREAASADQQAAQLRGQTEN